MKIKNGNKQDKYKMIKKTNIKKTCFLKKKRLKIIILSPLHFRLSKTNLVKFTIMPFL